jgi:hypothetical protein
VKQRKTKTTIATEKERKQGRRKTDKKKKLKNERKKKGRRTYRICLLFL